MQESSSSISIPGQEVAYIAPPMTVQEEDAIIHSRITNDEKGLRRVTKKFHNYMTVAYTPASTPPSSAISSVDDAREAFLVELASFQLLLKKSLMVCEAEARQVEEYQMEKERIADQHVNLKSQIEQLKLSLEHAQIQRRRKIEYDAIAEKINTLPSREELNASISSLENDMAAIRAEHENQSRIIYTQKNALDSMISELNSLRLMGKPEVAEDSRAASPTPGTNVEEDIEMGDSVSVRTREESGELKEDKEAGENERESEDEIPLARKLLNPGARSFTPSKSRTSTPVIRSSTARSTPTLSSKTPEDDDIEMGEVAEDPKDVKVKKKPREEELEEGEASDESSELSDPPDD
ncbi:uncharacterized protein LAESUDRAFT_655453 [Laetiporus sulphureus 93-53]|uniref:Uncharacterized protein n=1 Tax=Laetiporus sulphureus 93-53 TaxID=1314785 RepID=A0A165DSG2_9APHY|nr:uncharacterized protein LAESUDRAFT_655453 [Laetiporus sulphureus 93-53]KZT05536.1 hypothetical protein LAESUDRAFT_655453 [Laetiporus sulphureus 93-53]